MTEESVNLRPHAALAECFASVAWWQLRPDAEWFNPRDGQRFKAAQATPGRFETPDGQDWVLVISAGEA